MIDRLAQDHSNAQLLGEGLSVLPNFKILQRKIDTNIVMLSPPGDAASFVKYAEAKGVRFIAMGSQQIRAVTHRMIDRADIADVLARLSRS